MARKVRIQYPGAIYHVMNRGDRREAVFEDDEDRERLLHTLTEACQKTGWQVGAAASFAFLRHARSANLRASFAPRSRQSELMSQSSLSNPRLGDHHACELHRASPEAEAERIIAEELERRGWPEADLLARRKGRIREWLVGTHSTASQSAAQQIDQGRSGMRPYRLYQGLANAPRRKNLRG